MSDVLREALADMIDVAERCAWFVLKSTGQIPYDDRIRAARKALAAAARGEGDIEDDAQAIYNAPRDCWSGEFPISIDVARYIARALARRRGAGEG